jgi:hypothetical protein
MTDESLEQLVASIETMALDDLRSLWGKRYGAPPALRSVPIMRMVLAWRLQSEALGRLDETSRRMLARSGAAEPEGRHLGVGARLTRHWKGRRIEVVVEEGGFRWKERLFPSLSAAATAIAGSRWNGPRFFGLRDVS